jgi:methionyl-tRNA formyltransferase
MITFGDNPEIDEMEEERCGGYWKPVKMNEIVQLVEVLRFTSTKDPEYRSYLASHNHQYGIQGDVGEILNNTTIDKYQSGIINFHPGDLPLYRGCMAPEWQIYEGRSVICTAHILDEGIDTGDIIAKRSLNLNYGSYHEMRASVYSAISEFVAEMAIELSNGARLEGTSQGNGIYRKPMDAVKLSSLISQLNKGTVKFPQDISNGFLG